MPSVDLYERVTHAYAENNDVKIHYAQLGMGPLVVLIHAFRTSGTPGGTRWTHSPNTTGSLRWICAVTT